ncbi:hypothetical protein JK161_00375 [Leuconostoc mesenteroides]|uniref:hypothetical protein n=1 Tax=Leuconostoc mesenteroides TaxID=1245 RepID=UPI001B8B1DE2|nr:hypothetical protein [Leuconostoc mesenteroides]MBS0941300.1 hypothetical protein [Leuconostoc mesenteroides]
MSNIDWKLVVALLAFIISALSFWLSWLNRKDSREDKQKEVLDSQMKIEVLCTKNGTRASSNNKVITNYFEIRAVNVGKVDFKIVEGGLTWVTNNKNENGDYVRFNIVPPEQIEKVIKPSDDYKIKVTDQLIVDAFNQLRPNAQLKFNSSLLAKADVKLIPYVKNNLDKRLEGNFITY